MTTNALGSSPRCRRASSPSLSVGVLSADLLNLGRDVAMLEQIGVPMLHVDVMDGCFTPTMTVGPPLVKAVRTPLLKDVHLMIREPLDKLADFVAAGADIVTVHAESCDHVHRVLQQLEDGLHGASGQWAACRARAASASAAPSRRGR